MTFRSRRWGVGQKGRRAQPVVLNYDELICWTEIWLLSQNNWCTTRMHWEHSCTYKLEPDCHHVLYANLIGSCTMSILSWTWCAVRSRMRRYVRRWACRIYSPWNQHPWLIEMIHKLHEQYGLFRQQKLKDRNYIQYRATPRAHALLVIPIKLDPNIHYRQSLPPVFSAHKIGSSSVLQYHGNHHSTLYCS